MQNTTLIQEETNSHTGLQMLTAKHTIYFIAGH